MSVYDGPEFRALQTAYYDKLKSQGFEDIENNRGDLVDHRSVYDLSQRIGFKADLVEAIQQYHTWASELSFHGKFECISDKLIWILHAEGKSSRKIAALTDFDQSWICRKIKVIKAYLKKQILED